MPILHLHSILRSIQYLLLDFSYRVKYNVTFTNATAHTPTQKSFVSLFLENFVCHGNEFVVQIHVDYRFLYGFWMIVSIFLSFPLPFMAHADVEESFVSSEVHFSLLFYINVSNQDTWAFFCGDVPAFLSDSGRNVVFKN